MLHIIRRYFEQQHNGHAYEYFTREPEIYLSTDLVKFQYQQFCTMPSVTLFVTHFQDLREFFRLCTLASFPREALTPL